MRTESQKNLYYIHDPMCSWCYAFAPSLKKITLALQNQIQIQSLVGGLAVDSDQPMTEQTKRHVKEAWTRIEAEVPGTSFNFDFWEQCQPRRSTYPACRAVILARQSSTEHEKAMIDAIQQAYYQQAKNPSDDNLLCDLASEIGLNTAQFSNQLNSVETRELLAQELQLVRQLGVTCFPSMVLQNNQSTLLIPLSYTEPDTVITHIKTALK